MGAKKDSITLVVIAPKHAGKTVYLTALSNCAGVSLSDPSTIEVLTLHWKTLNEGSTPPATAGAINDLKFTYHCDVDKLPYDMEIGIPDYDGHFAETLSKYANSADIAKLRENIANADGFIVFMPIGDDDVRTMEEMRHEIGSFIGVAREVYDTEANIPVPLIIAVNKWDKAPSFKAKTENIDAENYIKSREIYNLIYERLQNYFASVTVMPLSAYGHRTNDANPKPGAMAPYRVTEPILLVISEYINTLKKGVDELHNKKEYADLASTLIHTEPLWKRWPGCDFSGLLKDALNACFINLKDELSQATKLKQFNLLWAHSPYSVFLEDFDASQQVALEKIKAPLIKQDKDKKLKISAFAAGILLICGLSWYVIQYTNSLKTDYTLAANSEAHHRYAALSRFVDKYGTDFLGGLVAGKTIDNAREQLKSMVDNLQATINERIAKLEEIPDSCAKVTDARQLIEISREMSQSISQDSIARLDVLLNSSEEICQAKSRVQTAATVEELDKAKSLLANKPETYEVRNIRNMITDKTSQFVAHAEKRLEEEKITPIRDSFMELNRTMNLADTKEFIMAYTHDSNPEVQNMVKNLESRLPEMVYTEIMEKINGVTSFDGPEFSDLRAFVLNNTTFLEDLSSEQRQNISAKLQEIAFKADTREIESIPEKVVSFQQLQQATDKIAAMANSDVYVLDGGLFAYQRPQNLVSELDSKIKSLGNYFQAIENGINASWQVVSGSRNAIDLDCENLIARDARLSISFLRSGMPDKSVEEMKQCRRIEGNGGYVFYTDGRVKPYAGAVALSKNKLFGSDNVCRANMEITNNDIIKLCNRETVRVDLRHNCTGIELIFAR